MCRRRCEACGLFRPLEAANESGDTNTSARKGDMRHKLLVVATAACLDFGLGRAAIAADLPIKPPADAPVPYNSSELHVGANFGGAFSAVRLKLVVRPSIPVRLLSPAASTSYSLSERGGDLI
jgi:hypothetical protein